MRHMIMIDNEIYVPNLNRYTSLLFGEEDGGSVAVT